MSNELQLIETYKKGGIRKLEVVREKISKNLKDYIRFILPRITETGLNLDQSDTVLSDDRGDDLLDIN